MSGFGTPISRMGLAVLKKLPGMEKVAKGASYDLLVDMVEKGGEGSAQKSKPGSSPGKLTYKKYVPKSGTVLVPAKTDTPLKKAMAKVTDYGKSAVWVANALGSSLLTAFMLKSFVDQANAQKQQDRLYEEQLRAYEEYRKQQQAKTAELKKEEPSEEKPVEFSKEAKLDLLNVGTLEGIPEGLSGQENQVEKLLTERFGGAV